jgi:hypothetical protein
MQENPYFYFTHNAPLKMKMYVALAFAGLVMAACKKDYTCRCITNNMSNASLGSYSTDTTARVYKNIYKRDAKLLCSDSKFTSVSGTTVNIGGNSNSSQNVTATKTCQLN